MVERTIGWFHGFRRPLVRHECYSMEFDEFIHLPSSHHSVRVLKLVCGNQGDLAMGQKERLRVGRGMG